MEVTRDTHPTTLQTTVVVTKAHRPGRLVGIIRQVLKGGELLEAVVKNEVVSFTVVDIEEAVALLCASDFGESKQLAKLIVEAR